MKPFHHSRISAKRFGGKSEDYDFIHNFMDSSKCAYADLPHRAILHSSFGIYLAEQVFGDTFVNSAGKEISVRTIAEQHVFDDMGWIPTPKDWLKNLPVEPWMNGRVGKKKQTKFIAFDNGEPK